MKNIISKKDTILLKYSKNTSFYKETKKDFFSENSKLLNRTLKQNNLYRSQPKRNSCKMCEKKLPDKIDFESHGIQYVFCENCEHLNGIYEDTREFVEKIYVSDDGDDYSQNYVDQDYINRTKDIYIPKIEFLNESLPIDNLSILDVGCGMGYLVHAGLLDNREINGIDVNKTMIDMGNKQIKKLLNKSPLQFVGEEAFYDIIKETNVPVISAIGVIEHLREPHKFFNAFKQSKAEYLFYSVPMFSFTVIMQILFQDIFPRHLPGEHTHLFTETSLNKMHEILDSKVVSQWRFGVDVMDLYRSTQIKLKQKNISLKTNNFFEHGFASQIDEIQNIFDKNHFCSEIHCIVKKNN